MPVLDEIATYLATAGSLTIGTDLFKSIMPEDPNNCVALYEYGGEPPILGLGDTGGVTWERPAVQVVVRNTSYSSARTIAETLYNAMAKVQADTLSGTLYHIVQPVQSPFLLERDEQRRSMIACNFIAEKERS